MSMHTYVYSCFVDSTCKNQRSTLNFKNILSAQSIVCNKMPSLLICASSSLKISELKLQTCA